MGRGGTRTPARPAVRRWRYISPHLRMRRYSAGLARGSSRPTFATRLDRAASFLAVSTRLLVPTNQLKQPSSILFRVNYSQREINGAKAIVKPDWFVLRPSGCAHFESLSVDTLSGVHASSHLHHLLS